jgi:hypothetical protein
MDTIYRWIGRYPSFSDQYARAREEQADTLADEIQALSDEPPRMMLGKFGDGRHRLASMAEAED